jgi:hypothetical protein
MSATYNEDIVGAIEVLVDLMSGNGFVMSREPYAPNYRGLVDALIDLKEGFPVFVPTQLGFNAQAGENISQGQPVYIDHTTGFVYKAIASGTEDQAHVAGFANQTKTTGQIVPVLIAGILPTTGLDVGDYYYLSATSAGAITNVPPSGAGKYVVPVGQAVTADQLSIQLEPTIKLS